MRSFIVALIVGVLGLTAITSVAAADKECSLQCYANGTKTNFDKIEIKISVDVSIEIDNSNEVMVIINKKINLVLAFDLSSTWIFIGKIDKTFGLIIDRKEGFCYQVAKIDISLIFAGNFVILKTIFTNAVSGSYKSSASVKINFTAIKDTKFDFTKIFTGDDRVVNEIQQEYLSVFQLCFDTTGKIGKSSDFIAVIIIATCGTTTQTVQAYANVVAVSITVHGKVAVEGAIYISQNINSDVTLTAYATLLITKEKSISACISAANTVDSTVKTITIGSVATTFQIISVGEYFVLNMVRSGFIIDIKYTKGVLIFVNNEANVITCLASNYFFVYSITANLGVLVKGSDAYLISHTTILSVSGATEINVYAIGVFMNNCATATSLVKSFTLTVFKGALKSASEFETLCADYGIPYEEASFKVFACYAGSITTSFLGSSISTSNALTVSFALNASLTINTDISSNGIIAGIATACSVVIKVSLTTVSSLFTSVKLAISIS